MAIKLVWSKRAEQGYARIINYLKEEWTDREIGNFVQETNHFFELLIENPHILKSTGHYKNLYRGPINRLTILTYRYKPRKKEIILVNIRSARQKPKEG